MRSNSAIRVVLVRTGSSMQPNLAVSGMAEGVAVIGGIRRQHAGRSRGGAGAGMQAGARAANARAQAFVRPRIGPTTSCAINTWSLWAMITVAQRTGLGDCG